MVYFDQGLIALFAATSTAWTCDKLSLFDAGSTWCHTGVCGMFATGSTNFKLLAPIAAPIQTTTAPSGHSSPPFLRILRSRQFRSTQTLEGHGTLNVVVFFFGSDGVRPFLLRSTN
jgi:hypothetical protein